MADVNRKRDYPGRFAAAVGRSVDQMLDVLQAQGKAVPPEETRALARHVLDFALPLPDLWPTTREVMGLLAPRMEQAGHRDDWQPVLEQAIARSQQYHDPAAEAGLHYRLGMLHELRTRFENACAEFAASAALYASLGDAHGEARACSRHAYVERLQGHHSEAERLVQQALALLPADAPEQADCVFIQGVIAYDNRQWAEAVAYLQRSVALCEGQHDQHRIARSLRNLGPALYRLERYDEAIGCYERAITLFGEIADPVQQAATRMNLGIIQSLQGNPQRALDLYGQAEPVFRHVQDDLRLAMIYTNAAIEHRKLQHWEEAEACCQQAIGAWQALHNLRSTLNALDELGLVYAGQGLHTKAIQTFDDALARMAESVDFPGSAAIREMLLGHRAEAAHTMEKEQGQEPH